VQSRAPDGDVYKDTASDSSPLHFREETPIRALPSGRVQVMAECRVFQQENCDMDGRMAAYGLVVSAVLATVLATPADAAGARPDVTIDLGTTTPDFCARAQRLAAASDLVPENTVYASYDEFVDAKPSLEPLVTRQYVLYEDDARTHPLRVSCKMKTPDQLVEAYGESAAHDAPASCASLNRAILGSVEHELPADDTARLRISPQAIVLDPDETTYLGSSWLAPYDFAYVDGDGALHLRAKSLHMDWDALWWSWRPQRVRGSFFCHLVAPEYLRRLILGETSAPVMAGE
jgi:hypothetical protein